MKEHEIFVISSDFNDFTTRGSIELQDMKIGHFPIRKLKSELEHITKAIGNVIDTQALNLKQYQLGEITIKLQVSTTGQLAILGNGISATGSGGIDLKFIKKKEEVSKEV